MLNAITDRRLNETIASFRVPGIYNNISNEAYHQGPGISRSALMEFRKSPYHYWYKYKNPDDVEEPPTSTQIFGNAFHSFILEPQKFASQFYILPKFDKRTKAGLERWRQIQREQANKTCLTQEQYQVLQHMAASLKQNGLALKLITNAQIEQSLYWNDPDTGILCKCRPDILRPRLVADLKTAQDGSAWAFFKAVYEYGYHVQAAMIREALQVIQGVDIQSFWFLVIEKSAPYVVSTYKLDAAALDKGKEDFKALLSRYQACLKTNHWPAYEAQEYPYPTMPFIKRKSYVSSNHTPQPLSSILGRGHGLCPSHCKE